MLEFGYIRLYRSLLNWEWYSDINTKTVFIHLLLTANYEPKKWCGVIVGRGQRVFSYGKLAIELNMSVQSVRTSINHLKSTGEVTCKATREYSVVTVNNYDSYQQLTCEPTNDQHTVNTPSTNDQQQCNKAKESKKANKANKSIYSTAFESYSQGDEPLLKALNDFAEMRTAIKKAFSTERAVQMLLTKLDGLASDRETKVAILEQSTFHNWQTVYPLKGDDSNGRFTNNAADHGKSTAGSTEEIPKYGKVY